MMSKPTSRPRLAASTQSRCTWAMSAVVISLARDANRTSDASWVGATRTDRDSPFRLDAPPWYSSRPTSAPWECTASTVSASARASASSQTLAATAGTSSASRDTGAYSTHTPPQPPSALIARNAACVRGLMVPKPDACGT